MSQNFVYDLRSSMSLISRLNHFCPARLSSCLVATSLRSSSPLAPVLVSSSQLQFSAAAFGSKPPVPSPQFRFSALVFDFSTRPRLSAALLCSQLQFLPLVLDSSTRLRSLTPTPQPTSCHLSWLGFSLWFLLCLPGFCLLVHSLPICAWFLLSTLTFMVLHSFSFCEHGP